ncbi:hypothetical protein ABZ801_01015 [Actinomadura sp. NPDC047616]|uniref:hypothetical protein n=1 Tax=Actinomadura sp. NPDC047616 TaxID=3155914 RepID=UPI0033E4C62B
MPLLSGAWEPQPPGSVPAPDPGPQPLKITYTDPDGNVWDWSDPTTGCVITHVSGLGSPPATVTSTSLPGGGALPSDYMPAQRQLVIGLDVALEPQDRFLELLDQLHRALWTERYGQPAPGKITVARPDGTARTLSVLCTSGPEQTDTDAARNAYTTSTVYALTFVSTTDPMFTDQTPTRLLFQTNVDNSGVPPLPPVRLRALRGFETQTITNPGSGDAYPVWVIDGPGRPVLTNQTTGRTLSLATPLVEGERVTIDTRPGQQQVIDSQGRDRWSDLVKTTPRDLWSLPAGDTEVTVRMDGAGASSKIELSFLPRWLRA